MLLEVSAHSLTYSPTTDAYAPVWSNRLAALFQVDGDVHSPEFIFRFCIRLANAKSLIEVIRSLTSLIPLYTRQRVKEKVYYESVESSRFAICRNTGGISQAHCQRIYLSASRLYKFP